MKPVDFDALLQALGAADAEPPPLMKKLLDGVAPVSPQIENDNRLTLEELQRWLAAIRADRESR